jgi:hypothetical protein
MLNVDVVGGFRLCFLRLTHEPSDDIGQITWNECRVAESDKPDVARTLVSCVRRNYVARV